MLILLLIAAVGKLLLKHTIQLQEIALPVILATRAFSARARLDVSSKFTETATNVNQNELQSESTSSLNGDIKLKIILIY